MRTDHIVENLANGEQETRERQVHYTALLETDSSFSTRKQKGRTEHTHGSSFAQDTNDQNRLQHVKHHETDERPELVQHIESDIPVVIL